MRHMLAVCFAVTLLIGSVTTAAARVSDVSSLASLREAVVRAVSEKMPGWTRKEITPMEGSDNVIIDNWESGDVEIKVAVLEHASREEAVESLKDFRSHLEAEDKAAEARGRHEFKRIKEELPGLGDSGFSWDSYGSTATSFRKSNFTVFISLVKNESSQKPHITKEFARLIAEALPNK